MSDSPQPFTRGWKITIVIAIVFALANIGLSTLQDREQRRFQNREARRIDDLESMVFDNDIGTSPRKALTIPRHGRKVNHIFFSRDGGMSVSSGYPPIIQHQDDDVRIESLKKRLDTIEEQLRDANAQ